MVERSRQLGPALRASQTPILTPIHQVALRNSKATKSSESCCLAREKTLKSKLFCEFAGDETNGIKSHEIVFSNKLQKRQNDFIPALACPRIASVDARGSPRLFRVGDPLY